MASVWVCVCNQRSPGGEAAVATQGAHPGSSRKSRCERNAQHLTCGEDDLPEAFAEQICAGHRGREA